MQAVDPDCFFAPQSHVPTGRATWTHARSAPNDAAAAPMSVEGTTPGPRAGAAASDDEAGEDEAGSGKAEVGGQCAARARRGGRETRCRGHGRL